MPNTEQLASVAVVGAGNTGSQLLPLLARNRKIGRIVAIDPDCYDMTNVAGQNILPRHVGMGKTAVQRKILQSINPGLQVRCEATEVSAVALGLLRVDLIVSGVDNRAARQVINQCAWRTGTPCLDMAVDADNRFCRINLYVPGRDTPCLECAWGDDDYAQLEVSHSCTGERVQSPPVAATAAPAELGALVASLASAQVSQVLEGDTSFAGRQLFMDARHYRLNVANMPLNRNCRFDHSTWKIAPTGKSPDEMSLGEALQLCSVNADASGEEAELRHEGQSFVTRLTCANCGAASNRILRLSGRLKPWQRRCHRCGGPRVASGFDQAPQLGASDIPATWLQRPMSDLGYGAADVFSVAQGKHVEHFEFGATDG